MLHGVLSRHTHNTSLAAQYSSSAELTATGFIYRNPIFDPPPIVQNRPSS